jgi:hypothetical protein
MPHRRLMCMGISHTKLRDKMICPSAVWAYRLGRICKRSTGQKVARVLPKAPRRWNKAGSRHQGSPPTPPEFCPIAIQDLAVRCAEMSSLAGATGLRNG